MCGNNLMCITIVNYPRHWLMWYYRVHLLVHVVGNSPWAMPFGLIFLNVLHIFVMNIHVHMYMQDIFLIKKNLESKILKCSTHGPFSALNY